MKQFESFGLDTSNECLWREGTKLALPPKPFAVLRYLVENPGRLITHDELLDALWPETYVQPQVLRTYVLELRKILGDDAGQPRFIQTLPKRGYCFVAQVTDRNELKHGSVATAALDIKPAGIVGREAELGHLKTHVEQLLKGQRCAVFITGEAGIGKTALVDAFCQQAEVISRVSVARGQCVEGFGGKEEYYPVMEALGQLCSSPDGERACRTLSRMAPAWLAAHGREDGIADTRNASDERMPGDLCGALEELAAEKSLILIFEDLHWADDSTVHLISALARRRAQAKLMVLVTYRPHDMAIEHRLKGVKQDLLMRRLCAEIPLPPLAKIAVKELLSRELKQEELPQGLASFVHKHSEGNPLFVIAILEHLIAQHFLVRACRGDATLWEQRAPFQEMEAGVPDGLAQMIELKIDRLNADEKSLLEAGSLISVAFPAWAVAAALGKDPAETEEACDALARRLYFLERAGQDELPDGTSSAFYVFAHGLYREVLYQRQVSARRSQRHIRIAERLGELFVGREANVAREIAMHYEAAGSWQRAAKALLAAAKYAEKRGAHVEAVQLLEHARRLAENLNETECAVATQEICGELAKAHESLARADVHERVTMTKV
ncbi:AAA family ATPase [Acidicapsa ligni]|uniref:AAA family ATPase n=1 Tax=Acidicapsa ligni TaxID=542300 RepID=UPI0021E0AC74|nr:AAA family ATPase [Acidicapsa ligni]